MNDLDLEKLNATDEYGNATLENVVAAVVAERSYNILLWMPFVIIPGSILFARLVKYLYKLHQSNKYGYDEDLLDDPLRQLGLAQLGFSINRGYDDLNDIRKIRKEQKKMEKRIIKSAQTTHAKQNDPITSPDITTTPNNGASATSAAHPLFLAENYLAAFHLRTQKTWVDRLSPAAIRRWFNASAVGRAWMIFQVLCTLVSIVNYVFLTYAIQSEERVLIKYLDVVLAAMFLVDYSISIYIAEDRLAFYFDPSSMIDLISIVPPFIYLVVREHSQFIWFLGLLRILRASRILRTYRLLSFSETEEKRELTIAGLTFCNFIFLSASIINALETINKDKQSSPSLVFWHDSLYYIMVTFSTIGFGDLTPSSIPSRIVVMFLIIFVIIYVPIQSGRISEIYNASSQYQRAKYSPSTRAAHVIISGSTTYSAIVDFCREFFAADTNSNVVILAQAEPSLLVKKLLRHPTYRNRIFYLYGSALSATDLKRAAAKYATALFLINEPVDMDSTSAQEDEQIRVTRGADAEILMQALVTKKIYPGIPVLGEVLDIRSEDLSAHCGCDRVLCSDKVKMSILARECLVPGFLALVLNMISTYSTDRNPLQDNEQWMYEYSLGASNHVFSFRIPPGLSQVKWDEVVETVFRTFNVTLFAVMSLSGPHIGKLRLNPGKSYTLRGDDVVFCLTSGGDEVILRVSIQFKDSIPREHLEMLELEAEMAAKLDPKGALTSSTESLSSPFIEATPASTSPTSQSHIILCGHVTARGIRKFVTSVRSAETDTFAATAESTPKDPVRIICLMDEVVKASDIAENEGDGGIWADILSDAHVKIMKGTPLKKTSLLAAGVADCQRIVIFSTPVESSAAAENAHILPDANSIFIIKMIQEEWPNTNFIVELVSGANVKYFSASQRNMEWNTDNLRMQSILNNYTLGIHDRITLYKKVRQRGADKENFLYRLYQFIWPSEQQQQSGDMMPRSNAGANNKTYNPITFFSSKILPKMPASSRTTDVPGDDTTGLLAATTSRPTLEIQTTQPLAHEQRNHHEGAAADDDIHAEPPADSPTGKASSSISSAYLQRLVEEAELNESGFSPTVSHHFDKNFAMGRVVPVSFLHSLLAQSYFRPYLGDVVTALASSVIQLPVPSALHGHKYSELVAHFLKRDMVPLGLYRTTNRKAQSPSKAKASASSYDAENKTSYVYTNCRGIDLVDQTDAVFVVPSSPV
ncbi:hypothetical protein HDU77_009456 [Chytriomyces hyalinus]|nr:hypothetical protein HDU77_009456 [Chytriomyces hyalinus]